MITKNECRAFQERKLAVSQRLQVIFSYLREMGKNPGKLSSKEETTLQIFVCEGDERALSFVCAKTQCTNYGPKMFPWARSLEGNKQLICSVHGQGQKSEQNCILYTTDRLLTCLKLCTRPILITYNLELRLMMLDVLKRPQTFLSILLFLLLCLNHFSAKCNVWGRVGTSKRLLLGTSQDILRTTQSFRLLGEQRPCCISRQPGCFMHCFFSLLVVDKPSQLHWGLHWSASFCQIQAGLHGYRRGTRGVILRHSSPRTDWSLNVLVSTS